MLSTIVIVDLVLFGLLALWVGIVNVTGNTDQRGGVGFVAFFLAIAILVISVITALTGLVINLIWN